MKVYVHEANQVVYQLHLENVVQHAVFEVSLCTDFVAWLQVDWLSRVQCMSILWSIGPPDQM